MILFANTKDSKILYRIGVDNMKKGFTLLELLGVIILLAVISLIATPVVLNVVEDAKISADKSTVYALLDAARLYKSEAMFDETKQAKIDNVHNIYDDVTLLNKPEEGKLHINNQGSTALSVIIRNKCYIKNLSDNEVTVKQASDCDLGWIGNDDVKPTISQEVIQGNMNHNGWYKEDIYIKVNIVDNESGVKGYKRCIGSSECEVTNDIYNSAIILTKERESNVVCVIGIDNQDNESEKNCITYKLDKTKPTIVGIENRKIELNSEIDLSSGITSEDNLSGIDGEIVITPDNVDTSKIGTTKVEYKVSDKAGNEIVVNRTIEVLGGAPNITYEVQESPFNNHNWAKNDFYVKGIIQDNSTKGIKSIKWCSTISNECTPVSISERNEITALITNESDNNHICIEAIDNNDKVTKLCSESYKLDKTSPSIVGIDPITINLDENVDLTKDVKVNDILSGIDGTYSYEPNDIDTTVIANTVVTYKVVDLAGNETVINRNVEVLGNAPSITFSNTGSFNSNSWAKADFYLNAAIQDNSTKGIKSIKWCSVAGDSCIPIATSTNLTLNTLVSQESTNNKMCVEAIDNNDKITTLCSENYKLDKTSPTIEGVTDITIQKNDSINLSSGVTYKDTLSGIEGNISITPASVDTSKAGTTNVTYKVVDKAGNERSIVRKIIVDADGPLITYAVQGAPFNNNGWAKSDFYVKGTIQDQSGLGIKSAKWCSSTSGTCTPVADLNGTVLNSLISSESSNNRICIQATDNNNKTSEVICSDTYKLDKTAPIAGTFNIDGTLGSNDWYITNVIITANNGTDSLSGHASTTLDISSITFDTSGTVVTLTTTDLAGNIATRNITIKRDATAPSVPSVPDLIPEHDTGSSNTDNITMYWYQVMVRGTADPNTLIALRNLNHSDDIIAWVSADGNGNWSANIDLVQNEWNHIYVWSGDEAGNWTQQPNYLAIYSDTIAPSVPNIVYNSGSNTCSWKNNYNLTLTSSDGVGIWKYQTNHNMDGNVHREIGSNFIPENGYSTCTDRYRAVDIAGNVSGWTEPQHIHMDTENPVHTNWWWGEVNKDVARLYVQATDNIGISRVQCPSSTESGGYANWNWFDAVWDTEANAYRCDITPATFNHYNQKYATHLYIYDHAGNGGYYNATEVNIPAQISITKYEYNGGITTIVNPSSEANPTVFEIPQVAKQDIAAGVLINHSFKAGDVVEITYRIDRNNGSGPYMDVTYFDSIGTNKMIESGYDMSSATKTKSVTIESDLTYIALNFRKSDSTSRTYFGKMYVYSITINGEKVL